MKKYYNPLFWISHPSMLVSTWMFHDWQNMSEADFVRKWLEDYSTSQNVVRKEIIRSIVFPMYKEITGRNYDAELLSTFNIKNPEIL